MKTAMQEYSDKLMCILGDMCNNFTQEQTLANHYALKEALEKEKEQIIEAYHIGCSNWDNDLSDGETHYNETFKP